MRHRGRKLPLNLKEEEEEARRQVEERWQPRQWLSFREHSLFLEQTGMPLSISYIP